MMNTTEMCLCGEKKERRVQWCSRCWGMIPRDDKSSYLRAVAYLRVAVSNCNEALHEAGQKEQPCL